MKVRKIIVLGLFALVMQTDLFAVDIKGKVGQAASTVGQKIKDAGSYVASIPDKIFAKIDRMISDYWGNIPTSNKVAVVRAGLSLSAGEKKALIKRVEHNTVALEKEFGEMPQVPKVALLCSGGGYRAMLITLGFLAGAQKTGLLDMITWMAGVSGGAWGIGTVMTKALSQDGSVDMAAFIAEQAKLLNNKPMKPLDKSEYRAIGNILMVQSIGHQLFTTVNIFGALLANRIFGFLAPEDRQKQLISHQSRLVKAGKWPIPIYTVVQYDLGLPVADYRWVEFNPWEYGGTWLHSYAPIWGTSRNYHDGKSTNYYVERSLGFMLGMCGSAFAAEFKDVYESMKGGLYAFVRSIIERSLLPRYATSRVTWGQLQNYTKGLSVSPIKEEVYLNLIDAGFTCNLPYPPLSGQRPERKPDVLIMLDSSTTPLESLKAVERYAKKHSLKLPPIEYDGADQRFVSVFVDEKNSDVPVVVFIHRMSDPVLLERLEDSEFREYAKWVSGFDLASCIQNGPCVFTNFIYPEQTMMQVAKTIEFQTIASKRVIFDAIKTAVTRKKSWWKIWQ